MREIMVHAETGEEALADGAAALGVDLAAVQVEIVESDPHGVTARVYVVDESAAQGPVGRERGGRSRSPTTACWRASTSARCCG